jgi:hypothetical protein
MVVGGVMHSSSTFVIFDSRIVVSGLEMTRLYELLSVDVMVLRRSGWDRRVVLSFCGSFFFVCWVGGVRCWLYCGCAVSRRSN